VFLQLTHSIMAACRGEAPFMSTSTAVSRPMTSVEWSLLLTLTVLWGGSFFFNGVALRELPTFTVVVARVALAAVVLIAVVQLTGARIPGGRQVWGAFFVMGFLNNVVPFSLIVWGQAHIGSGAASILNATTPLFTVVFAHYLTADEKMTVGRLAGVVLGLLGVTVMVGGTALTSLDIDVLAQTACLAAAVSYASAGIYGRRFKALDVSPLATAAGQVIASSLMMIPIMLVVDRPWTLAMPSTAAVLALVGVATLSTALAYVLYFRLLATAGASNLLLVTFLIPVSAVLLGVVVLHEILLGRHIVGMALIGCGIAAIDGRPWRAIRYRLRAASAG
jgi:drug/metabolite transporter (DMT)-like permease